MARPGAARGRAGPAQDGARGFDPRPALLPRRALGRIDRLFPLGMAGSLAGIIACVQAAGALASRGHSTGSA
jgi:hypothetical protein